VAYQLAMRDMGNPPRAFGGNLLGFEQIWGQPYRKTIGFILSC